METTRAYKKWTLDEVEQLIRDNKGYCPCCGHKLAIYKYRANHTAAIMLRKIADRVRDSGSKQVNYDDIPVPHALHSQRSKLRQHGLIAKYKEDGKHVASMWVITNKGWDWLTGKPIPAVVLVFDNQVLGHEGGEITITEALGENKKANEFEQKTVTPDESKVYGSLRSDPKTAVRYNALYKGRSDSASQPKRGQQYEIAVGRLQMGQPVKVDCPLNANVPPEIYHAEYKDVATFQKNWQIVSGAL